jgi:alpha-1,2-mannosyltransferase
MATAGRLIQDDLALMIERSDGQYYLLAGSILLAGFWRLTDKFGMPLSEIHTSGFVPAFKPKLERGMMNLFRRLQPHNPVVRNNFFIQVDPDLAWSTTLGPEDGNIGWINSGPAADVTRHQLRTERQSLGRLPRSGAIVFTIRVYLEPIVSIATEKGVPGRLASAIRGWGEETAKYKGREKYGEALLKYLDRRHREQVESGEVAERDGADGEGVQEGTKYPF